LSSERSQASAHIGLARSSQASVGRHGGLIRQNTGQTRSRNRLAAVGHWPSNSGALQVVVPDGDVGRERFLAGRGEGALTHLRLGLLLLRHFGL
jgi:hypothetical protein